MKSKDMISTPGVIFYYSATGNTKLAAEFLSRHLGCEMRDVRAGTPDPSTLGFIGIASPTDYMEEPQQMRQFLESLPLQKNMPAFILVTHGGLPGRTSFNIAKALAAKGFSVIGCHVLKAPDNYPPIVARGRPKDMLLPTDTEFASLQEFVSGLKHSLEEISQGREVPPIKVKASLIPHISRARSKKSQGAKYVDPELCTRCGACSRACPYSAIKLSPLPVFDEDKCWGCWACFNLCPAKAIYTKKFRGRGHYPGPLKRYKEKLGRTQG